MTTPTLTPTSASTPKTKPAKTKKRIETWQTRWSAQGKAKIGEAHRDVLTILARLGDPEMATIAASFALGTLIAITARPADLKHLGEYGSELLRDQIERESRFRFR